MLGRKKKTQNEIFEAEALEAEERAVAEAAAENDRRSKLPEKKGVPTPRRKDREAARKRPLVHNDRKVARAAHRKAMNEQRAKVRRAMETGEERYLPVRDRGPQKRFVRDYVDARWGLGEWLLIIVLIFLFASFLMTEDARATVALSLYIVMFAVIIECWWVARQVRQRLDTKFGAENRERGVRFYAIMRVLQLRRLRLPKPLVGRGEYPS